jgi:Second Messenger Oligonucleotide or Dinucleotide Synthetase domain
MSFTSLSSLLGGPIQSSALSAYGTAPAPQVFPYRWIGVRPRFTQFNQELALTPLQYSDGITKSGGVVGCLNRHYYGSESRTDNSFFIGSWGKNTAGRPPRDVDLYFVLPVEVYYRFQGRVWNRQSALLQEVKNALAETYPDTDMSGDGQIVLVRFESYSVEVVPSFLLKSGSYWICDTNNGGRYKENNPWAEVNHIESVDQATNRNLRPLIRMIKAWQDHCSVHIKSFQLELIAAEFLAQSPWRLHDFLWFDWISRDFFLYLYWKANTYITVPGGTEVIYLGNDWQSRAESAYWRAVKACDYEKDNQIAEAGEEWQKIFGQQIPRTV